MLRKKQGTGTGDFLCLPLCDSSCLSNPFQTCPAAHAQLQLCAKNRREGAKHLLISPTTFLQSFAWDLCPELRVRSCPWLSCWPSGLLGRGPGPGRPPCPNSCRHRLPASGTVAVFRGFSSSRCYCSLFFCDAARRNNQTDCLPAGWVPGHLHSQLVRHRSPCFF